MVVYIGVGLIRKAPNTGREVETGDPLLKVAAICFSVTWLNPQAIIDGSLLLGGFKASLPAEYANTFIFGVAAASFLWFTGLTTIVSIFRSMVGPKTLRWINIICGSIIVYYGLSLALKFFRS